MCKATADSGDSNGEQRRRTAGVRGSHSGADRENITGQNEGLTGGRRADDRTTVALVVEQHAAPDETKPRRGVIMPQMIGIEGIRGGGGARTVMTATQNMSTAAAAVTRGNHPGRPEGRNPMRGKRERRKSQRRRGEGPEERRRRTQGDLRPAERTSRTCPRSRWRRGSGLGRCSTRSCNLGPFSSILYGIL